MTTVEEYLFSWESHIRLLNELLLKWRYIRDMEVEHMPLYIGTKVKPVMPEAIKELAVVQVDLLQSALHNIEHEIIAIKCNCKVVEIDAESRKS